MIEQLAEMPTYEAYKDSGVEWLGEIPMHWEIKRVKDLVKINCATFQKKQNAEFIVTQNKSCYWIKLKIRGDDAR